MNSLGIYFERYKSLQAQERREMVRAVYEASYVDAITSGHEFDSVTSFMHRFDSYVTNPELDLVAAFTSDGLPVGQTWGWPLGANSRWWAGLAVEPDPEFTYENGKRTFALSEIMVSKSYAGQGIAKALHDCLLSRRDEERATLLVESDNPRAYHAYLKWGWAKVAELRPDWVDAPKFDVLILAPLPQQ